MILQLKNFGVIKSAKIDFKGLTVVAGKNDTGKSTIGKLLFMIIKAEIITRNKIKNKYFLKDKEHEVNKLKRLTFNKLKRLLFDNSFEITSYLSETKKEHYKIVISDNDNYEDITYIQSPLIWDLHNFFSSILQMQSQIELEEDIKFNIQYPYLLWDLYGKLIRKKIKNYDTSNFRQTMIKNIENIIKGRFIKKEGNIFVFRRNNVDMHIVNVSSGIKSFGILQVLLENGYISKHSMLIIDEPEANLHPEWQLKYAEILTKLVKEGVKIILQSHSPYIIEAIKRYSEKYNIDDRVNFYLAKNGYVKQQEGLENIFKELAIPMRKLKEMKLSNL